MSIKPIIALDADGVLLDYGLAYASVWERAFGQRPVERDKDAYFPFNRWAVEFLDGDRLAALRARMDEQFWSCVPPWSELLMPVIGFTMRAMSWYVSRLCPRSSKRRASGTCGMRGFRSSA